MQEKRRERGNWTTALRLEAFWLDSQGTQSCPLQPRCTQSRGQAHGFHTGEGDG